MIRWTALALALCASGAHAESRDLLQSAAAQLSTATGAPVLLVLGGDAGSSGMAMTLRIPAWAEYPANAQDARAVISMLAAYQAPIDQLQPGRTTKTLQTVAGLAAQVAVSANHRYRDGYRNGYEPSMLDNVPRDDDDSGDIRARRTLALLGKMGSCTGALVAAMNRVQATAPSGNAQLLFNRVRGDLGRLIYPPDNSCIVN